MDTGFRSVIGSDGAMHLEHQVGTIRFDLASGQMTQVLPSPSGMRSVIRSNGSFGLEQTIGNMRFNIEQGSYDLLL
ncbi:MAG TPA: hypothetical protein IAA15_09510 [Candidatus Olsenella pullicola]|nr:hypothetical protein [Candidatus Olsenella pullicola]